ncbi:hypothetical protein HMPREF1544_07972 [Mucor circinelloides 1006PhL]|uniref:Uncharacterized protein n=1 Tax=Mucor circinelloides f. circinelloides (strain 1006PhL) TaxID=1220926 RepID=S2J9T3_MUCC1|nr:hypothetical protein HMPREF1544_07972 [Mucor circinelloides 1006PhL]
MVVYILNSSSKISGAISRCFDTLCSMSFAMLFLPGLVLSASHSYCYVVSRRVQWIRQQEAQQKGGVPEY